MSGAPVPIVVAHGGTTSSPRQRSAVRKAAQRGLDAMGDGPLAAAIEAVRALEDDARFHAGTGSTYRLDGQTIEMDAAAMASDGRFGSVTCLEGVRNPILVARALVGLPCPSLAGPGAQAFARRLGLPPYDPGTPKARREWRHLVRKVARGEAGPDDNEWDEPMLRQAWNYDRPLEEVFPDGVRPPHQRARPRGRGARASRPVRPLSADTVGAVAYDGTTFAAAGSTSGMTATLRGRIADIAMPGCGLLATPAGAVACSGNGDHLLRLRMATRVLEGLDASLDGPAALRQALALVPPGVDCALVLLGRDGWWSDGNRQIAVAAAHA